MGLAILVRFTVLSGQMERFMTEIRANAATSVREEAGCRRFDILTNAERPDDQVVLYEIYDDAAAFETHLQSPHFAAFQTAVKDIVGGSIVQRLALQENAKTS